MTIALGTNDGVWMLEDGKFTSNALLRGAKVNHVATRNGTILASIPGDGLYKLGNGNQHRIWEGDARACAIGPNGTYYLGIEPAMVFRSNDEGDRWKRLDQIDQLPTREKWYFPPPPHEPHVRSIDLIHESDRNVLVGVEVGGVLMSSNYGDTWVELNDGLNVDVHTVRSDPSNPGNLIAVTGGGVYISENMGQSWDHATEGLRQGYAVGIHINPDKLGEILLATGDRPPGLNAQIYHSLNGGYSWRRLVGSGLPDHFERVPVVFFAEGSAWIATDEGEILRADNPNTRWTSIVKIPTSINAASAGGSPSSVSSGF